MQWRSFGLVLGFCFFLSEAVYAQNEDFESSVGDTVLSINQIAGWTISGGLVGNSSCSITNCCPNPPVETLLIHAHSGYVDSNLPGRVYSVFGVGANNGAGLFPSSPHTSGNNFLRLNGSSAGAKIQVASKTLTVTNVNALFQFAFLAVIEAGTHACCEGQSFHVKVTNVSMNTVVSCQDLVVNAPSFICSDSTVTFYNFAPFSDIIEYTDWNVSAFDLSPYLGQVITIDFSINDCIFGGHFGYAYLDAQASPLQMGNNGNPLSISNSTIVASSCGSGSLVLTAPVGLGPYSWSGPNVTTLQNTSLLSNQVFTAVVPGDYTLTMAPITNCTPISKVITVSLTPAASVDIAGTSTLCAGSSAEFTVTGANTYTWSGNQNTDTLVVSPTGKTSYSVTGIDLNGCLANDSHTLTIFPLPNLLVSGPASVCVGSIATFTLSGASSYSLNGSQSSSLANVMPYITDTYTVSGANNSNCPVTQFITLLVDSTCANVWPGDVNNDGVANNLDILELGLHITQTGPGRSTISNSWQSWQSANWAGSISNGQNLNHADCNGDGILDVTDTQAVSLNYDSAHAFKSESIYSTNPDLYLLAEQNYVNAGAWGSVSILLGDSSNPVSDLNGIAFTLNFDPQLIEADSIALQYPVSFLNAANNNLNFSKYKYLNGVVYAATSHTATFPASGNGKVATFYFKISTAVNGYAQLPISLANSYKSNTYGTLRALTSGTTGIDINPVVLGTMSNLSAIVVYPNPSSNYIRLETTREIDKLEMLSLDGKVMLQKNGNTSTRFLDLKEWARGVYFLKIYSQDHLPVIQKIILSSE